MKSWFSKLFSSQNPFRYWFSIQAISIFVATNMAIQGTAFFQNVILGWDPEYDGGEYVWAAYPIVIILILIFYFASKKLFSYTNRITEGIEKVANGDYAVKLPVKKGGPYREVYRNFNKMTDQLNSVETLRNDFINKFSHEFKTPITSINGFSELLLNTEVEEADKKLYLEIIAKESARLAELANNVMILTALESQEIVIDQEEYDLEEQLKQTAILILPQLSQKEIRLTVELNPMHYVGNPNMMNHVWTNILNNAIKFTPENGTITITSEQTSEGLIVSITDTGIGMDEETQMRIFSKFYQVDKSGIENGLGLGLSIVQRVISLIGGRIEVESELGKGTTFRVILPVGER